MKIPFSEILGPYLRRYDWEIQGLCAPCLFGSSAYVITLSVVAMITTMMDIMTLIKKDALTPCFLRSLNPRICPSLVKSFKLFSSGINFINYLSLCIGGIWEHAVLLMPYLMLQFINIILLSLLIILAILMKFKKFKKTTILVFVFMIHNWMHVFCCFRSYLRFTDF